MAKKEHWSYKLAEMDACREALLWLGTQPDPKAAWKACARGDWMLWIAGRMAEHGSKEHRQVVRTACACARLALVHVPAGEERPLRAIELAECWADGDSNVTLDQVRAARAAAAAYAAAYVADAATAAAAPAAAPAAAYAADAAAYAAAAAPATAYAADATAYAVYAAAYAAYAAAAAVYAAYAAAAAVYAADAAARAADAAAAARAAADAALKACADVCRQHLKLGWILRAYRKAVTV